MASTGSATLRPPAEVGRGDRGAAAVDLAQPVLQRALHPARRAYMKKGQPATAEGMLRRAIEYDPNNKVGPLPARASSCSGRAAPRRRSRSSRSPSACRDSSDAMTRVGLIARCCLLLAAWRPASRLRHAAPSTPTARRGRSPSWTSPREAGLAHAVGLRRRRAQALHHRDQRRRRRLRRLRQRRLARRARAERHAARGGHPRRASAGPPAKRRPTGSTGKRTTGRSAT